MRWIFSAVVRSRKHLYSYHRTADDLDERNADDSADIMEELASEVLLSFSAVYVHIVAS